MPMRSRLHRAVEHAIDLSMLDAASVIIAHLDVMDGDCDLEDDERELETDEDMRGVVPDMSLRDREWSTPGESFYSKRYCPCCGAVTETEEWTIA